MTSFALADAEFFAQFDQGCGIRDRRRVGGELSRRGRHRGIGTAEGAALLLPTLLRPRRHQHGLRQSAEYGQRRGPDRIRRQGRRRTGDQQRTGGRRNQTRVGADRPHHARGQAPERHGHHEHHAVRGCQGPDQDGRSHPEGNPDHQRQSPVRTVLQRRGAGDRGTAARGDGRPRHTHPGTPVQRGDDRQQDAEQATGHLADVRPRNSRRP